MNTILNKLTLKSNKPLCNVGDPKNVFTNVAVWFIACLAFAGTIGTTPAFGASISMTSSGAQSIDVMPGAGGETGTSIGVDNINVVTDCKAGYNFSLSTSVSDNNLYLNGDSSNNTSGKYFTPADGTSTLTGSPNTWGYLVSDSAPTASSTFSAVPALGNPVFIKTTASTASSSDINDSFNIYYGVAVSNGLAPGTYKMIPDTNNSNHDGTITYFVTMDTSCETYTISYNANSGSGSIEDQIVSGGNTAVLADNAFTRANHYFMGWSTNQNATTPEYRTNQTITPTGDMALYAVWGSSTSQTLYNIVASLTRGNQTNDTNATTGIQTNPTKATSGVWTYNASTFGTASDASTSNPIYYYRGILDATTGSYGSDGDSMDYPNYVKLGITCWRIVRTTGSGGVKMIYNGMYGNTTSGSCANATTAAQIRATSATTATSTATFISNFAGAANAQRYSIVSVGYTRNNTYASTSATTATAYSTLFGTNSSYSSNSTNSTIKGNIETWFTNNLNSYSSILEPSAGYCNDRSIRSSSSSTSLIADSTTIVPYGTSGMTQYYFGPYVRNITTSDTPTLTCPRDTVDLYTTSSAGNGNKQLSKPVALLTADEMSFAGSGSSTASQGSGYNSNSYLRSGSDFWLLSPDYRYSNGNVFGFTLYSNGYLNGYDVYNRNGVRPAISLTSGTTAASGSGTATDPWVIEEPKAMQDLTLSQCQKNVGANGNASGVGDEIAVYDKRDGSDYTVRYINDACWMTANLALGSSTTMTLTPDDTNISSNYILPKRGTYGTSASGQYVWGNDTQCTSSSTTACAGYYSYAAATAGTNTNSGAASSDICPKGWRLPTSAELTTLKNTYTTSATLTASPFLGVYAGYYGSSSFFDGGSYGNYWSSTAYNSSYAYNLNFDSSSVYVSYSRKDRGYSIRCVAKS